MSSAVYILLAALLALACVVAYVRLAPAAPGTFHVDPFSFGQSGPNAVHIAPPEAPVFETTPEGLHAALQKAILAEPRSKVWATSPDAFHTTYVTRTRLMGYPDYISVAVRAAEGGASFAVYSRSRFGYSDLGVNRARLDRLLGRLRSDLGGS